MTRRQLKVAPVPPRTHESVIGELISATEALLKMDAQSGDGVAIQPWEREALHRRVVGAIAGARRAT